MVPPKPAHSLVRHPKRLLMDDIIMHLARYANDERCTLIVMSDVNTDLSKDDGRDLPHFNRVLTDLDLVSAAHSRWKAASLHFKTHKGDEVTVRRKQITSWCRSVASARCRRSAY